MRELMYYILLKIYSSTFLPFDFILLIFFPSLNSSAGSQVINHTRYKLQKKRDFSIFIFLHVGTEPRRSSVSPEGVKNSPG